MTDTKLWHCHCTSNDDEFHYILLTDNKPKALELSLQAEPDTHETEWVITELVLTKDIIHNIALFYR